MAKTYNTIGTFTAGNVLTAAEMNDIGENVNNYRVPPMVKCTRSGNLSYTSNTDIAWNDEDYDTDTMHDTVTNNARITPTTAGIYLVTFSVAYTFSGTSADFQIFIQKNGSDAANRFYNVSRTTLHRDVISAVIDFNGSTDYVTCKFSMGGGSNFSVTENAQSYFSAAWLGQVS